MFSFRTTFDPFVGRMKSTDGGLLGDLIPEQTFLKSKAVGDYDCLFTEAGVGSINELAVIRFENGQYMGLRNLTGEKLRAGMKPVEFPSHTHLQKSFLQGGFGYDPRYRVKRGKEDMSEAVISFETLR